MSIEEVITSFPTVANATMDDIIMAVQGYTSPSVLGTSVQESLSQVFELFQTNIILYNSGNPNGAIAGSTFQFCWNTTNSTLWICTTTGTSSTAVWTKVGSGIQWHLVMGVSQLAQLNQGYVTSDSALTTITLPTSFSFGDTVRVAGNGTGGWTLRAGAGTIINVGTQVTTSGGTVSSVHTNDSIEIVATATNTSWMMVSSVTTTFVVA